MKRVDLKITALVPDDLIEEFINECIDSYTLNEAITNALDSYFSPLYGKWRVTYNVSDADVSSYD